MPTTQQQVLNTVELLELVFSNLTMRDVLASERVSYVWRSVISSSPPAQRRKYIMPEPSLPHGPQINPMYFQGFYQKVVLYAIRQTNSTATIHGPASFVRDRVETFADEHASWRRMLLFQPPSPTA